MPQRIAVRLTPKAERNIKKGHPWVFEDGIQKMAKDYVAGDLAIVFSEKTDKLIAIGLIDPQSPIRIKIIHHGKAVTVDEDFFESRIKQAFNLRSSLLQTNTNAYRLIFGENDFFPGLIVDVYDRVVVIKLYSEIWSPYLDTLISLLADFLSPHAIVLRFSRTLLKTQAYLGYTEGQVIYGTLATPVVTFIEHGVKFSAHVIKGHKTGYFLDHRHNRKRVGELAKNNTVLDVFSYAGGFSVHALAGGAKQVTSVDISPQALALAKENARLNPYRGTHTILCGDAFELLQKLVAKNLTYEVVVIDPPTFANKQSQVKGAVAKYIELIELGAQLTAKNGLLVMASCSARVPSSLFFEMVESTLAQSGRLFAAVDKTYHDRDHPISFEEGAYLKCGYYRADIN